MLHAASAVGSVYLALVAPGMVEPMVLANQVGYGLITGYATLPAGQYDAVVSANGREWRQPVEFLGGEPTSLLLSDGPDGPVLRTLLDVPEDPAALNPSTLTIPASEGGLDRSKAKPPAIERSDGRRIAVVLCVAAMIGAAILTARARPARRAGLQNRPVLRDAVRARGRVKCSVPPVRACGRGGEVIRRAPPADTTARLPRGAVKRPVPPRRPGQQNDAARPEAVRAHWRDVVRRARPVDTTARLDREFDTTAQLPSRAFKPAVPREPR
jgi:hypothetical protein